MPRRINRKRRKTGQLNKNWIKNVKKVVKPKAIYAKGVSGIDDLDINISKYLDLGTLGKMEQLNKGHKKLLKGQQERKFQNWEIFQDFNTRELNVKQLDILNEDWNTLYNNKEFINMVSQKPITDTTILNISRGTLHFSGIRGINKSFLLAKLSLDKVGQDKAYQAEYIINNVDIIKELKNTYNDPLMNFDVNLRLKKIIRDIIPKFVELTKKMLNNLTNI